MNTLVNKLLIGLASLAVVSAPLAASAQDWHGDRDRGSVQRHDDRDRYEHRDRDHRVYERPVYRRTWVNGYYGVSPYGYQGYYWNGRWYHHRRWNGGIWIYF